MQQLNLNSKFSLENLQMDDKKNSGSIMLWGHAVLPCCGVHLSPKLDGSLQINTKLFVLKLCMHMSYIIFILIRPFCDPFCPVDGGILIMEETPETDGRYYRKRLSTFILSTKDFLANSKK